MSISDESPPNASSFPSHHQTKLGAGFTLIEMIVVIAVIGVLMSLLLPALSGARNRAHASACQSNLRQFALAFQMYAQDHQDAILPNRDGEAIPLGETWVEGWLGLPGPDATNTQHLRRSLLGPYLGGPELWRCPAPRDPTVIGIRQGRVRTLSLNAFMGSPVEVAHATTYQRVGDIVRPSPAEALVFVDERIDTINDASFGLQWNFEEKQPGNWVLRDKPSAEHGTGANLTFADGHVKLRKWRDQRTVGAPRDDSPSPGNQDVLWIQRRATWREPAEER